MIPKWMKYSEMSILNNKINKIMIKLENGFEISISRLLEQKERGELTHSQILQILKLS